MKLTMRILFVNSWYYPNMKGGAEQSVKLLAEALIKNGHTVAVISADGKINAIEKDNINGVRVYRVKTYLEDTNKNLIAKVNRKLKDIKYTKNTKLIKFIIKDFSPDVIHTNSLSGFSPYIWKISTELNIPVIHTLRDYGLFSPRGILETTESASFPYNFFLNYYSSQNKESTKYVSYVTAPSEYTLSAHCKNGYFPNAQSKCVVNAVSLNIEATRASIEERKNRSGKNKTIIFAGRLLELKGIRLLLKAFSLLDDPSLKLVICGEGELEEFVRKTAQRDNRIIYLGQVSQEILSSQYKNADIAVFPSLWDEPFGRVIIEANKYGLPVISSNRGGIPEVITAIGGGEIFVDETADCLAKKIDDMLNTDLNKYYNSIIKNISLFDIKYQVDEFQNIYSELIHIREEKATSRG